MYSKRNMKSVGFSSNDQTHPVSNMSQSFIVGNVSQLAGSCPKTTAVQAPCHLLIYVVQLIMLNIKGIGATKLWQVARENTILAWHLCSQLDGLGLNFNVKDGSVGLFLFILEPKEGDKYFYTLQEERIEQAERSVLISCPAKTNNKKLLKYLSRHGNINTFYISYVSISVVLRYESTNQHECMETKAMLSVCNYSMMGNSISKNN